MILIVSARKQLLERVLADGARPSWLVALAKTDLEGVALYPGIRIERIQADRFSLSAGLAARKRIGSIDSNIAASAGSSAVSPIAFLAARSSAYGYDNVLGFALALAGPSKRVTALAAGASSSLGWGDWIGRRISRGARDTIGAVAAYALWPILGLFLRSEK